jgi:ureidoglycolate lyase
MTARLVPIEITAGAFAPCGDIVQATPDGRRTDLSKGLDNRRSTAAIALYTQTIRPSTLPLIVEKMERHRYSSQTFLPLSVERYLVIVAPHDRAGGPDMAHARAFLCRGDQGITYRADVWHHPMTPLDHDAKFAVFMWRDGDQYDEEFHQLKQSVRVG